MTVTSLRDWILSKREPKQARFSDTSNWYATMSGMRLDHVVYAAERDGLNSTAHRLGALIGVEPLDGGVHPRFGTRNVILPLADHRYLEVVGVLEHPAAEKAPFGQAVRARSECGGGWLGWVVAVENMAEHEKRLGRQAVEGCRRRPDGTELRWQQLGIKGLMSDPQLPFFIEFSPGTEHPSEDAEADVTIESIEIAGDPDRVHDWLGRSADLTSADINFTFVAPRGTPGMMSVTFTTPEGTVVI